MGDPESVLGSRYRRNAKGNLLEKLFGFYRTEKKKEGNYSVPSGGDSKSWDSVSDYSKIEDNRKFKKFVLKNVFQQDVRFKRDVREATKYVETALVLDKAMVSDFKTARVLIHFSILRFLNPKKKKFSTVFF